MLLIPLFLLLCGCAQTRDNIPTATDRGAASTQMPPYNTTPPSPVSLSVNLNVLPAAEGFSVSPVALPTQTTQPASASLLTQTLPQAGVLSLENLILTALEPVGSTMYVWGGGWNEADTGAGPEALSIGCSERWSKFAAEQGSNYNHQNFRYRIHDGLDCSGYIGWVLYNLFHTEDSQSESDGYVMKSTLMAKTFAEYGWGELISASEAAEWKPGDICSMSGHVWLSLGMCQDGSVLLLHASPPGVRICGTASGNGNKTDAVKLAEKWMSECYPEWYAKFPKCNVSDTYLTTSDIMRWNSDTFKDIEQFQEMSAEEITAYFMPEDTQCD